jgi:hypothetical protein
MFFNLLKLAGLDNAKIAELKAELAFKAEQALEHVTHKARTLAVVAGLLWCAGIMALLALIVGLAALYKWGEIHYGVFTGFTLVAAVLIALTGILVIVALLIARQSAAAPPVSRIVPDPVPPTQATRQITDNDLRTAQGFVPPSGRSQTAKPEDLVEPLIVLLGQYLRPPETGYQALDDLLHQIGSRAQGTTEEAVARGSELVRKGNRATMLSVLGAATLFGFLLARGAQHRDVSTGCDFR